MRPASYLLASIIGYLAINALLYGAVVRRSKFGATEKGIFLYQTFSFWLLFGLAGLYALTVRNGHGIELVSCAVSLHGMYSLSFLECWSLTQGSYSLSILQALGNTANSAVSERLTALTAIGPRKTKERFDALVKSGLIRINEARSSELTPIGRICAILLKAILKVSNGRILNQ